LSERGEGSALGSEVTSVERSTDSRWWWFAAAGFVGIYGALAVLVRIAPANVLDDSVLGWVSRGRVSFLDGTMEWISWSTDLRPRLVLGVVGVVGIALAGRYRLAAATAFAVAMTIIPINTLDLVGGIVAGRERPNGAPFAAFPSGHTLGTLVQFGLAIYLALRMTGRRRLLVPVVAVLAFPVVLVGPARVFTKAHWPTDVLGAYLLGVASIIALVLVLEAGERWLAKRGLLGDPPRRDLGARA
jgi:undecaprenyl-diphosphatase